MINFLLILKNSSILIPTFLEFKLINKRDIIRCSVSGLQQCELEEGELLPVLARNWEHILKIDFVVVVVSVFFFFFFCCCKPDVVLPSDLVYNNEISSPSAWPRMSQYLFALWPIPLCLALSMYLSPDTGSWFEEVYRLEPSSLECVSAIHRTGRFLVNFDIFVYTGISFVFEWGFTHLCLNTVFLLVLQIMVVCYKFEMCISYLMEGLWLTRLEESGLEF